MNSSRGTGFRHARECPTGRSEPCDFLRAFQQAGFLLRFRHGGCFPVQPLRCLDWTLGLQAGSLYSPEFHESSDEYSMLTDAPPRLFSRSSSRSIAGAARRALSFDLPRRDKRVPKQSDTVQVNLFRGQHRFDWRVPSHRAPPWIICMSTCRKVLVVIEAWG